MKSCREVEFLWPIVLQCPNPKLILGLEKEREERVGGRVGGGRGGGGGEEGKGMCQHRVKI